MMGEYGILKMARLYPQSPNRSVGTESDMSREDMVSRVCVTRQSDSCSVSCLTKYNLRDELSTQIRTKAHYLAELTYKIRRLQCVWD